MAGLLTAGMDPNEAFKIASQNGLTVDQAAQQMGYSAADVNQWLANNNKQAPAVASSAYQAPEPAPAADVWQQKPGGTITASTDPMEAYKIAMRNGMTAGDVARQMGVGVNDVNQWLTDNKLPMNHGGGFLAGVVNNVNQQGYDIDSVAPTLWQAARGKTLEEISLETGYSPQEIAEYMKRNNLAPTAPGMKDYYSGLTQVVPGGGSPMLDSQNRPTGEWNGAGVLDPNAYINQYGMQFGPGGWSSEELAKMRAGYVPAGAGAGSGAGGGAGGTGGTGGTGGAGGVGTGSGTGAGGQFGGNYNNGSYADPNTAGYNSPMARDQLAYMLNQDTPYMQAAKTAGLQHAAGRGLLNSSMAAEAAQKAMVEAAGPIAQQDADFWQALDKMDKEFKNNLQLDTNKELFANARAEYQADQQLRSDYLKSISNINAQDINPEDKKQAVEHLAELYRTSGIRGVMDRVEIGSDGIVTFKQGDTSITAENSAGGAKAASNDWNDYDKKADMPAAMRLEYENRYGTYYEPAQVRWLQGAGTDIAYKLGNMNYQSVPYSQYQPSANDPIGSGRFQSKYTGQVFTGKDGAYARIAFDDEFEKRAKERGVTLNRPELQKLFGWQSIEPAQTPDYGGGP